jgi:hypothetical protein
VIETVHRRHGHPVKGTRRAEIMPNARLKPDRLRFGLADAGTSMVKLPSS